MVKAAQQTEEDGMRLGIILHRDANRPVPAQPFRIPIVACVSNVLCSGWEDTDAPSGSPELLERRRLRAIALLQQGMAAVEVARHVCVDRRSLRRWRAGHDRAGGAGVDEKPAPGRPAKLNARRRARLERVLLRGAEAVGFKTLLWTCPRVADIVRREFGVR